MKTFSSFRLAACFIVAAYPAAHAQSFDSGSVGTNALMVTTNTTLDMPPDGIFHFTTITINSGTTLTFRKNPLNTPVYLLAKSNVVINGNIDISGTRGNGFVPGTGGPGGFDGGHGQNGQAPRGDGKGPGGGKSSLSTSGYGVNASFTYGNALCAPLVGGSGGGGSTIYFTTPGQGGGGGGGAILIASSTSILFNGVISATGERGGFAGYEAGGGCGGAIRLVAPLVDGGGTLNVPAWGGNYGRTRIDSSDRLAARNLVTSPAGAASITRGSQMFVFPPTNRLDIIEAGGMTFPAGFSSQVYFAFPAGPPTNITVRVQADGLFYGATNVPIRVVVTPENGASANYDTAIDIRQGTPAATNVTVTLPAGTTSFIHAWTR